jgi:SP family facilitated glucose transporter-like MFS transporter 8
MPSRNTQVDDPLEPAVVTAVASTAAAGLGALIFGFSLGFTGPSLTAMEVVRQDTMFQDARIETLADGTIFVDSRQASTFSSILTIGAMVGSMSGGVLCDKFGRKNTIMAASIPFMLGWFFIATTTHFSIFLSARCLIGLTVGVVSMAVPLYISESAPTHLRGALGAVNQLEVTIGILLAYAVGYAAEERQQTRVACGWAVATAETTEQAEDEEEGSFWTSDMGQSNAEWGRECDAVVAGWTCRDPASGMKAVVGGASCQGSFLETGGTTDACFCEGHLPQWRVLAWVATALSTALFTAMAFAPETPSFILHSRAKEVERAKAIRASSSSSSSSSVTNKMSSGAHAEKVVVDGGDDNPWMLLWNRMMEPRSSLRWPMTVGIALMVFQQFSGINAIICEWGGVYF